MKNYLRPLLGLGALLAFTFLAPLGWAYFSVMAVLAMLQGAWCLNSKRPGLRTALASGAVLDGLLALLGAYSALGLGAGASLADTSFVDLLFDVLEFGVTLPVQTMGFLLLALLPGLTGILLAHWINVRVRRLAPPGYLGSYGHPAPVSTPPPTN